MADTRMRFENIFGYVTMRDEYEPVYGKQLPHVIVEDFDGNGRLISRKRVPPAIQIIYGDEC